jgi:alkanesulfonate monooxygenase SsuD/methylene tetrahydromethanopterin reductase-like flavin-dependent oxidoreductase (luciferase family)
MWTAWAAGDRKGALAAIPDEVVDELIVHGSPEQCREQVARYGEAGVDVPVMALVPTPELEKGGATALAGLITGLGRG